MAALEAEIFSALAGVSGMTAIVGSSPNERIYPVQAPQNATAPFIVFTVISERDIAVNMGSDAGVYESRVQVDIYAAKLAAAGHARALRDLVRTALKRLRNSTIKDSIEINGGARSFVTDPDLYRITMEYKIWHS